MIEIWNKRTIEENDVKRLFYEEMKMKEYSITAYWKRCYRSTDWHVLNIRNFTKVYLL